MKQYQRLNFSEREELSRCLAIGLSNRQISRLTNRSPSTIYREILRNGPTRCRYRALNAQRQARRVSKKPRRPRKLDSNQKLREIVVQYLQLRWSPEQIAKRLRILYPEDITMRISHETIYSYVYVHPRSTLKRELMCQLRRHHKDRRIKGKLLRNSSPIQNYTSIDDRPSEVNGREIAGHWEGDLIKGKMNKSAIGTLVERKTRMTFIAKLKDEGTRSVRQAFARKFNRLPANLKRSLTYDQGKEMAEHKIFTEKTKIQVYFAHPHSPWEGV